MHHGLWIPFCHRSEMKMLTRIKFMLGRGMCVKKNDGASDIKWNGKFRMLNGKRDIMIKRVVLNRDAIVSKLILVEERV